MKSYTKKILIILLLVSSIVEAKSLQALFSHGRFYSTKDGSFVETYLSVSGHSVNYIKTASGQYQATITVNIRVNNADGKQFYNETYNLNSPQIKDTGSIAFNFIDQQRIPLPNGIYTIALTIADKNGNGKSFSSTDQVNIDFKPNLINISDIVLLDNYSKTDTENVFTKNGYELVPFVDNFYPKTINTLKFYAEVYNTSLVLGDGTPFLLSYHLENYETKQVLDNYSVMKKQLSTPVAVILSEFNINELPSGNYKLVVELRDKSNQLLSFNETYLQRSKNLATIGQQKIENVNIENTFVSKISNKDSITEYVACLRPICNASESIWQENQLKLADTKIMQQYFYDFWIRKDAVSPEKAWLEYKKQVEIAQLNFGDRFTKGYMTDRGRVFLQYGPPNSIDHNEREPDAYPYEIWHYYKIESQSNRKFIFYNTSLVGNDYKLLHSDMNGELHNSNWNMDLYKRNSQTNNMDIEKRQQYMGNESIDNFNHPK